MQPRRAIHHRREMAEQRGRFRVFPINQRRRISALAGIRLRFRRGGVGVFLFEREQQRPSVRLKMRGGGAF